MLALEAENVALRAENSDLHEGENAKQSITDFLLKDCEDKLANSLAKRRDEQETHEAVVDAKNSVIRELQADRDKSLDTIKTTLAKIKLYKAKYESMSTTAKSNQKEAEKTQRMLFLALVAVVIFAFLATVYALVVSASSSKDSLAQCQNMI